MYQIYAYAILMFIFFSISAIVDYNGNNAKAAIGFGFLGAGFLDVLICTCLISVFPDATVEIVALLGFVVCPAVGVLGVTAGIFSEMFIVFLEPLIKALK